MKFIATLILFTSFFVNGQPWLNEGLVAFFPFDEIVKDESGNNYVTTVSEVSFASDRFDQPNSSAAFTGQNSSYIEVDGLLNDYSQATISIWANWSGETTAHPAQYFFNKPRNENGTGLSARLHTEIMDIGATLTPTSSQPGTAIHDGKFPDPNEWNHYVVVHSAPGLSLYINGENVGFSGYSTFEFLSQIPFQIGRLGPTPACCGITSTWNFSGDLDDLRVYNRALTAQEVSQLFEFESINSNSTERRSAVAVSQVVNGFVVSVEILNGGYGYTSAPEVTISGGGGSGAEAVAVISAGRVTGIQITNTGSGYSGTPTVSVAPPPTPLTRALASAQVVNGFIVGIELLDPGYGYNEPPQVSIIGGNGSGADVVAVVADGRIVDFDILSTGSGYSENVVIQIAPPPFAPEMSIRVKSIELNLHLVVGKTYAIEASTDFNQWTQISDPFIAEEEFMAFEYDLEAFGQYYRVVELP